MAFPVSMVDSAAEHIGGAREFLLALLVEGALHPLSLLCRDRAPALVYRGCSYHVLSRDRRGTRHGPDSGGGQGDHVLLYRAGNRRPCQWPAQPVDGEPEESGPRLPRGDNDLRGDLWTEQW